MRRIYKCLLLLLLVAATPAHAQHDEQAMAAAIDTIVRVYTAKSDSTLRLIVDEVYQKQAKGKNAFLAYSIAKAYYKYSTEDVYTADHSYKRRKFYALDTVQSFRYINEAIRVNPRYPEPYSLACSILDYDGASNGKPEQRDAAMRWLNRGIAQNPSDSTLYLAKARVLARTSSMDAAKNCLQDYLQYNATFPVNLYIARIYNEIDLKGNEYLHEIADHYGQIDAANMTLGDIETYAYSLFYSGDNEKCNAVCAQYLPQYPKSLTLNRFYLRSLIPLERYPQALTTFNNLQHVEGVTLEMRDSMSYATALAGTGRYDEGFALFDELLAKPEMKPNDRQDLYYYYNKFVQNRIKELTDSDRYAQAAVIYKPFYERLRAEGAVTDQIRNNYASFYINWAATLEGHERHAMLMKADPVLLEGVVKSENNNDLFAFLRFYRIYATIDPEGKSGDAIPVIAQMESVIRSKGEPTEVNKSRLIQGYRYMMSYYYLTKKDYPHAADYARKILALDPENESAQNIINILYHRR